MNKSHVQTTDPCSNHEIRVLVEHGFYLKIFKPGIENEHFVYASVDVNVVSGNDVFDIQFCKLMPFLYKEIQPTKCDYFNVFFFSVFGAILDWNQGKSKNNDHTCFFHCINIFRVPWKIFEHSALRPRVQTASSGPGKC